MENNEQFSINSSGQVVLNSTFTELVGNASLGAYTDYENRNNPSYVPPALNYGTRPFQYVTRFTGFDSVPWGSGQEERFGLIYQWSARADVYLFAFRGTSSAYDMWKDLESASTANFNPYHRPSNFPNVVHVGKGFNDIYATKNSSMLASMQGQLFNAIKQLPTKPRQIIITGHSLGCALGSLFALDVAASLPGIQITNMNFASPRVGTGTWETTYDTMYALRPHTIRVRNDYDLVPTVPPEWSPFDFRHVGRQFDVSYSPTSYFHNPVDIVEAWHSLLNYRYVVYQAVTNSPQIWTGKFKNQAKPHFDMESYKPNTQTIDWASGELKKVLESLRSDKEECA